MSVVSGSATVGGVNLTALAELTLPTVSPRKAMLGIYHGGPSTDADATSIFGKPDIASTYYQWNQIPKVMEWEPARVRAGIIPLVTLTTKGGTVTLNNIAAKTPAAVAYVAQYVAALDALSKVDPAIPVYATLDHEFEVKQNQGVITGVTEQTYAAAFNVFAAALRQDAPTVKLLYWFGGSDKASISTILAGITVAPDFMAYDPYSMSNHPSSETFEQTVSGVAAWLRGNTDYRRLGSAPIGLAEFGTSTSHGDVSCAVWLTGLRDHIDNLGLVFGVFFNRDNPDFKITGGAFPLSVAALRASIKG